MSDARRTKADWHRWADFDRPFVSPDYRPSLRTWVIGEISSGMPDPHVERWATRKGLKPVPW